jgi:hypothetical protein
MGCFDIYCFICGNTYWNSDFTETIDDAEKIKNYSNIYNKMNWLNECTLLLTNDEIIHNCLNIDCGTGFGLKQKKNNDKFESYNISTHSYLSKINYFQKPYRQFGIFLHTDCWKFVKKTYNIELVYSILPINQKTNIFTIKYLPISKYWGQDTDYLKMYFDKNIWMAFSPLDSSNKKNIVRIKKIIQQFKFKNDPNRKGPAISATFYPNNYIKQGNNSKFWIKNKGKWNEIKEKVIKIIIIDLNKLSLIQLNLINKIPQIGEANTIPLFINKISYKKNTIELIGDNKNIIDLKNKINL